MTEQDQSMTTEATDNIEVQATEPDAVVDDQDGGDDRLRRVRGEAKNLRDRLRQTETERDQLREQVGTWQRRQAEQVATDGTRALANGSDLWVAGIDLADLLDDAGLVDDGKVRQAVEGVVSERPHWAKAGFVPLGDQGFRGNASAAGPTWGDAISAGLRS